MLFVPPLAQTQHFTPVPPLVLKQALEPQSKAPWHWRGLPHRMQRFGSPRCEILQGVDVIADSSVQIWSDRPDTRIGRSLESTWHPRCAADGTAPISTPIRLGQTRDPVSMTVRATAADTWRRDTLPSKELWAREQTRETLTCAGGPFLNPRTARPSSESQPSCVAPAKKMENRNGKT